MPSTGSWSFLRLVIMIVFRSLISIPGTGREGGVRAAASQDVEAGIVFSSDMSDDTECHQIWAELGTLHCNLAIVFSLSLSLSLCHQFLFKPGLLSSQTEVVEKHATIEIIAIFLWTYFMIKFWYFVIQNLDKACYINFLIGTLVQLWVACPHYLLISSKHRIRAEKDYNLWPDFKWLRQIFQHYAMTNNFLPRMEMKLMPCSQQALCVLQFMISTPPPPPTDKPFEGNC